ncbi:MAG: hypothetical protein MUO73_08425, partial [Thermoplasmata archaeon]|nr:hypothetical protein [Thermoplasmata archaeon]
KQQVFSSPHQLLLSLLHQDFTLLERGDLKKITVFNIIGVYDLTGKCNNNTSPRYPCLPY